MPGVTVQILHAPNQRSVFPAWLEVWYPSWKKYFYSKELLLKSFSPSATCIFCRVSEPSILVANNSTNKPGVAGGTGNRKLQFWAFRDYKNIVLSTCNRCSFLLHPVCIQACHCSCPPFCRHPAHLLDVS